MDELDELRLKIAQAKGWRFWKMDANPKMQYACPPGENPEPMGYGHRMTEVDTVTCAWAFDDDATDWPRSIADAWTLEAEIPEDQRIAYSNILYEIVRVDDNYTNGLRWALAHATPEQRCRAWLAWKTGAR